VLYSYGSQPGCKDGCKPSGGLVIDAAGNLYGTTVAGGGASVAGTVSKLGMDGTEKVGTVLEVSPTGIETVLHSFTQQNGDGAYPDAGLLIGKKGSLYNNDGKRRSLR
jgi:hypothetical protein